MSLALALLVLVSAPELVAAAPDDASVELGEIVRQFGLRSRGSSETALARLVARAPRSEAAERARLWLGSLALEDKQLDRAAGYFTEAARETPHGELAALARRGLGDVALTRGDYATALAAYEAAKPDAPPPLLAELEDKRSLAARERLHHRVEDGCWLVYLACAAWLALRLRGRPRALPTEVTVLAPVYVIFVALAWPRDPAVGRALAWIATGSLVAVTLLFAAPGARRRVFVDCLVALAMHAAFIFIALRRNGLLDKLWMTLGER